jgi:hypothetical protein
MALLETIYLMPLQLMETQIDKKELKLLEKSLLLLLVFLKEPLLPMLKVFHMLNILKMILKFTQSLISNFKSKTIMKLKLLDLLIPPMININMTLKKNFMKVGFMLEISLKMKIILNLLKKIMFKLPLKESN